MALLQRNPRTYSSIQTPTIGVCFEEHEKYEEQLQSIRKSPYLNSEVLLEEIRLKKMKLHCKDEMERIALRIERARAAHG